MNVSTPTRPQRRAFRLPAAAFVLLALGAGAGSASAQSASSSTPSSAVASSRSADSAAVVAVVERLHDALQRADSAAVLDLLAEDVVILESGGIENRAEYRGHHLPADIAFARAVPSQRQVRSVRVGGDLAWVAATSTTQGEFRGRPVNSAGAELIVLTRVGAGWKVAAIHWSSRARRG